MTKGHQGYIDHTKKRNLFFGLTGIVAMFVIYMIGLMVTGSNGSFGTLLAVLVALPSAQMLTRYFSLIKFHSTSKQIVAEMEQLKNVTCLYELVVVQGKEHYFIQAAIITNTRLLILDDMDQVKSDRIQKMLFHKGIQIQVSTYDTTSEISEQIDDLEIKVNKTHTDVAQKLVENAL